MSVASNRPDTAATDAAKLLTRLGLATLMIGLPAAGLVSHGAIYVLLPVGAALLLVGSMLDTPEHGLRHLRTGLFSPLGAAALLLGAWAALSLLWTPFPSFAAERFFKMVGPSLLALAVAAFLPEKTKPFDLYMLPAGLTVTAVAALALAYFGTPWFWHGAGFDETLLDRSVITSIVLVWPALGALALREHWILAAGLALLVAGVALVGFAQTALAAMGAGAFTFAVSMSAPGRAARALAVLFAGVVLLAPLLPLVIGLVPVLAGSVPAPIAVWKDIVIGQWLRLVTGHGLDLAHIGKNLGFLPAETPQSLLFLLWYDLGAVGAFAFAALVALAFLAAGKVSALVAPALLAGLVAVLVIAFLGIAAAQIWWMTLLASAAIAFALVGKAVHRTQRPVAAPSGSDAAGAGAEA